MTWAEIQPLLTTACWETLYMVGWSTVITAGIGLPLGVLLVLTSRGGLLQNVVLNKVIGVVVNITRSLPFIILMVALIPFTRWLVGAAFGLNAAVVMLSVGAIPFFARLVETSIREVDPGLVEAVHAMGGNTRTVVVKALLPESLPSLVSGLTTTVIALVGYSAMAGTISAGGLGNLAWTYGYQRFENKVMIATIVLLIALVTVVQLAGDLTARALARRGARTSGAPKLRLLRAARVAETTETS